MAEPRNCRIRLRLPTGAELETEGEPDFVRQESQRLLGLLGSAPSPGKSPEPQGTAVWKEIVDAQKGGLLLRSKPAPGDIEQACLLLLGAAKALLGSDRPTATQLARWLRQSSCPFPRLDRVLADAVRRGDILAAGYRRSRRYELTSSGQAKATLAALRTAQSF